MVARGFAMVERDYAARQAACDLESARQCLGRAARQAACDLESAQQCLGRARARAARGAAGNL